MTQKVPLSVLTLGPSQFYLQSLHSAQGFHSVLFMNLATQHWGKVQWPFCVYTDMRIHMSVKEQERE